MGSKWATQDMGALKGTKFGHHCVECDGHFHCRGFLIRRSGGTARCVCVSVSGRRDNALSYVTLETLNPPRLPRAYLPSSLALFGQLRILYHCRLSRIRCFSFLWHVIPSPPTPPPPPPPSPPASPSPLNLTNYVTPVPPPLPLSSHTCASYHLLNN